MFVHRHAVDGTQVHYFAGIDHSLSEPHRLLFAQPVQTNRHEPGRGLVVLDAAVADPQNEASELRLRKRLFVPSAGDDLDRCDHDLWASKKPRITF